MKSFIKKYETVIRYFTFGLLPVIVSFGVYVLVIDLGMLIFGGDEHAGALLVVVAKTLSWFATSVAAYFVNMVFVFKRRPPTVRGIIAQLTKHTSARIGTYAIGLAITVSVKYVMQHTAYHGDVVFTPDNVGWFVGCAFEVLVNYFVAKSVVFRKSAVKSDVN
jgi:putative flippase GtrA